MVEKGVLLFFFTFECKSHTLFCIVVVQKIKIVSFLQKVAQLMDAGLSLSF